MSSDLLDDQAVVEFIVNGYTLVQTSPALEFHTRICNELDRIYADEGNPGNNILPRLPELGQVFASGPVRGALTSLLGPGYSMHPHRYCHLNCPGGEGQGWHKDDYVFDQNVRHHRFRWVMAFYYPQDVTADMGATGIMPGRQFYNTISSSSAAECTETELKLCGPAGTVALVNFDVWHRATPNLSQNNRYMLKFQFLRMTEPEAPTWNNQVTAMPKVSSDMHPGLSRDVWRWLRGKSCSANEGQDVATPLAALVDGNETEQLDAAYDLGALGGPAVAPLIEALRRQAQDLLEADLAGNASNPQGSNPGELSAAFALAAVGKPAVQPLVEELRNKDWRVRAVAADALGNIGLEAVEAASVLSQCLLDENLWVRRNAAEALGNLEEGAESLADVLDDDDERVRRNAALALAKIGPGAAESVPGLVELLRDESRYVRHNAVLALQRIGTPGSLQAVVDDLSNARWCPITSKQSPY